MCVCVWERGKNCSHAPSLFLLHIVLWHFGSQLDYVHSIMLRCQKTNLGLATLSRRQFSVSAALTSFSAVAQFCNCTSLILFCRPVCPAFCLLSIRVIKYYAWENNFRTLIKDVRQQELSTVRKFAMARVSYCVYLCMRRRKRQEKLARRYMC